METWGDAYTQINTRRWGNIPFQPFIGIEKNNDTECVCLLEKSPPFFNSSLGAFLRRAWHFWPKRFTSDKYDSLGKQGGDKSGSSLHLVILVL